MRPRAHTCTHIHTPTHTYAHARAYSRARAHAHTHTHTGDTELMRRKHTRRLPPARYPSAFVEEAVPTRHQDPTPAHTPASASTSTSTSMLAHQDPTPARTPASASTSASTLAADTPCLNMACYALEQVCARACMSEFLHAVVIMCYDDTHAHAHAHAHAHTHTRSHWHTHTHTHIIHIHTCHTPLHTRPRGGAGRVRTSTRERRDL